MSEICPKQKIKSQRSVDINDKINQITKPFPRILHGNENGIRWNICNKGRSAANEIRMKYALVTEWFQENKDWIDDVLTVFFSGLLVVNILSFTRCCLMIMKKCMVNNKNGFLREISKCLHD